ncbi:MFS transporter [Lentilactobacillus senioris]|uniref:MFS transporter n=1 Tax=Lentilactobacillus senioris TaxID=931534 RepID=UPI0022800B69|nr:MFS transporter [Lentilactobacillus senioris]MCY9806592.1 MFS transporter [Lentilactobacillus senioris]
MSKKYLTMVVVLIAANLRLAVTGMTPIFSTIQSAWKVDSTYTSLLMTIPLLCFAIGAMLTPQILKQIGLNWFVALSAVLLAVANLLRVINVATMLTGTILVGLAIAFLNVLVTTIIAQYRPSDATQLTSYYSLTMSLFSAIGMGLVVPMSNLVSWQFSIQLFSIPAIIALIVWLLSQKKLQTGLQQPIKKTDAQPISFMQTLLHDHYAWLLALFMGLQSLIFYSLNTWLPSIYVDHGVSSATAGFMLSLFQLIGIPSALLLTWIFNKRIILTIILIGYVGGMLSILLNGIGLWISALLLGFTSALIFTLAMALITSSSNRMEVIAVRSGFAQFIGYLIAAVGPLLFGQLHSVTGGWLSVIITFIIFMVVTISIGFKITASEQFPQ